MLAVAAQEDGFRVNYQGAKPTIKDFSKAYISSLLNPEDEEPEGDGLYMYESIQKAMVCQEKGQPLEKDKTLTIDLKNGFLVYEEKDDYYVNRIEMCYWNEADGKHKLFAYNVRGFSNGTYSPGQFDGLLFYRYDNATKKMTYCDAPGFDEIYGTDDGALISYSLPRTGKDIIYTEWTDKGKRKQKTLKWNGRKFSF